MVVVVAMVMTMSDYVNGLFLFVLPCLFWLFALWLFALLLWFCMYGLGFRVGPRV